MAGAGAGPGSAAAASASFGNRPLSPAKRYLHARTSAANFPSPPSSPLRYASSVAAGPSSPRFHPRPPSRRWTRRPVLLRFLLFFLAGLLIGFITFLPSSPSAPSSLYSPPPPSAAEGTRGENWPLIIFITPTRAGPMQAHGLLRLAHTLRLVPPPLVWLLAESPASLDTARLLRRSGLSYRHISCECPANASDAVLRNAALDHVDLHRLDGIVLFADVAGVHSLPLFDHLRRIRTFATWPVAEFDQDMRMVLDSPVCADGSVVGWYTDRRGRIDRQRFHAHMSGFAFNSTMLWDPKRRIRLAWDPIRQLEKIEQDLQATTFIEQLVEDESQMEAIPLGCSEIMTWYLPLNAEQQLHPKGWQIGRNLEVNMPLK